MPSLLHVLTRYEIILILLVDDLEHSILHSEVTPFAFEVFGDFEAEREFTVLAFLLLDLVRVLIRVGSFTISFDDGYHILAIHFDFFLRDSRYIHVNDVLLRCDYIGSRNETIRSSLQLALMWSYHDESTLVDGDLRNSEARAPILGVLVALLFIFALDNSFDEGLIGIINLQAQVALEVGAQFGLAVLEYHIAHRELTVHWDEDCLEPILEEGEDPRVDCQPQETIVTDEAHMSSVLCFEPEDVLLLEFLTQRVDGRHFGTLYGSTSRVDLRHLSRPHMVEDLRRFYLLEVMYDDDLPERFGGVLEITRETI